MNNIRKDFPILSQKINGKPIIYFDNAATTQKPEKVIEAIVNFYAKTNANVYRGIYSLAESATFLFEQARKKIANFINANPSEIIFTSGTTGAINLVALSWASQNISQDDEIIISQMEHHSNLIPWQQLAATKKAILKIIRVTKTGELDLIEYEQLLTTKTKLVSVIHVSNVLGTTNDINFITNKAHQVGAKVLIDAAQSVAHQKIDVKEIKCDFLAFSGHKLLGPTGIGVLYINKALHKEIDPYQFGGGMIFEASFDKSTFLDVPQKFEAGTPPITQAIGLAAAIDYITENIDFSKLKSHESALCTKLIEGLLKFPQIKILGPVDQLKKQGHIVSFVISDIHPHDVAAFLDSHGIFVRAGHHCTQPLHKELGIESSMRVSFYGYNTIEEVDYFIETLKTLFSTKDLFKK